jgi:predicted ester cyclase
MIENENTAIVRRWFEELWNQRRLETIDELLAPDAVSYDLAGPDSTLRGRDAFRAAAETLLAAFGELHFTVEDIFGVDDRVAIRLSFISGTPVRSAGFPQLERRRRFRSCACSLCGPALSRADGIIGMLPVRFASRTHR